MKTETDQSLVEQGKRAAQISNRCRSVLVADANICGKVTRAYFTCRDQPVPRSHTVHYTVAGDEWWRDSTTGEWRYSLKSLRNVNWQGADPNE